MRTYLAKRLLLIVPTLFGVAAVVFVIMRVIPGDVSLLILGGDQTGRIDPQQLAAMRHQLGLDQPLAVQFGAWLWGVLRLDFDGTWLDQTPASPRPLDGTVFSSAVPLDTNNNPNGSLINNRRYAASAGYDHSFTAVT